MGIRRNYMWMVGLALIGHVWAQEKADVGRKVFESQCALCHGQSGGGGRGPSLNRPKLERAPDEQALRALISEGYGDMPGAWQLHPDEVAGVAKYVRSLGAMPAEKVAGDASRGAKVFATSGCKGCHIVGGEGEGFGPELTSVGARRSAAFLRQTILKPAATLPDGFQYVAVTTGQGGATVRGVRVNEDSFTIQVREAGGRYHSFRKAEVREVQRLAGQTPMPSYEGKIAGADMDDLVAYLVSLKGRP